MAKSMFAPGECFKAAIVLPPILYWMERCIYHHTVDYSLIYPAIVFACAVFFGIVGLFGG